MQTNPLCRKTLSMDPPICLPGWVERGCGGESLPGCSLLPGGRAGQATVQDTCPTTWRPEGKAGAAGLALGPQRGRAAPQTEGLCRRRTVLEELNALPPNTLPPPRPPALPFSPSLPFPPTPCYGLLDTSRQQS